MDAICTIRHIKNDITYVMPVKARKGELGIGCGYGEGESKESGIYLYIYLLAIFLRPLIVAHALSVEISFLLILRVVNT